MSWSNAATPTNGWIRWANEGCFEFFVGRGAAVCRAHRLSLPVVLIRLNKEKDSINPVNSQDFSVPVDESLAQAVARAMGDLPGNVHPVVVVDSPLAAASLRVCLGQTGWPGRDQGAPLPWCGTLEDALAHRVNTHGQHGVRGRDIGLPRSLMARRVQLAQQLLDYTPLARSLGGSAKAALDLAGQWVDLFEGWEWLQADGVQFDRTVGQAAHLRDDISTLVVLWKQNQHPMDRVAWLGRCAPPADPNRQVWFCMSRTPSLRERAMAKTLWSVTDAQLHVWAHAAVSLPITAVHARQLIAANTLEESAWAAAQTLLDWRAQGCDDIGVVALDRKIVRRLRSLLERAAEPLSDSSGWALDTTVAASAVSGLADVLTCRSTTQSILEWVHSPFVRQSLEARFGFDARARQALDGTVRSFGRIALVDVTQWMAGGLLPMDAQVLKPLMATDRRSMAQWADTLLQALEYCGLEEALADDHAGQAVLAAIQSLCAESAEGPAAEGALISPAVWQSVLAEHLNRARFVEPVPGAAIRVVSLSSLTWQLPKAVLVVGADASRLPERAMAQFFEPQRFAEMGLALDPDELEAQRFAQFAALWAAPVPMVFLACSEKPDSEVEFSNWIAALTADPPLRAAEQIIARPLHLHESGADAQAPTIDAPEIWPTWPHALPSQLSVSSAQSLVDCPYQYLLERAMGLQGVDDLTEQTAVSDVGALVHLVLKDACRPFASRENCLQWLTDRVDAVLLSPFFTHPTTRDAFDMPDALRTQLRAEVMALLPRLADWLVRRPEATTEHSVQRPLPTSGVTLKGRIDRMEVAAAPQGGDRLIDFKTGDEAKLRQRVGPNGRDVQLPLYAWLVSEGLAQPKVEQAMYVAIRRDGAHEVTYPEADFAQRIDEVVAQVDGAFAELAHGGRVRPLALEQDPTVCDHCRVRGVCRRDEVPYGR